MTESVKQVLTDVQRELLGLAQRHGDASLDEISLPPWDIDKRCHWTAYVPEEVYQHWESLPLEAKLLAYVGALQAREADPNLHGFWES